MKSNKEQQNGDYGIQKEEQSDIKPNLKGDILNLVFIILLCILQGLPMGISLAIKTYMQNMKISYTEQAKFGIVDLPYSLKLLWAPLMDAAYLPRIGKRKTWIVPIQFCIGMSWIFIGTNLDSWLTADGSHMTILTCMFFCVNALASTQDIAIDGWAITILKKENIGYASTCITSGQSLGITFGYVFFILLESEQFCNKWLRFTNKEGGIITMKGYLYFWGIVYIVATLSLAIFKKDNSNKLTNSKQINVIQTYKLLWKILNLQTIKTFIFVMLTYEFAFSSLGSTVSNPKFMELGVAKEDIALVEMSLIPIRVFIPVIVSKYTTGPNPLKIFYKSVPFRTILGLSTAVLIYFTPYFFSDDNHYGTQLFLLIFEANRIMRLLFNVIMYLGVQAFFSKISDPRISGTYMSLLNTVWYFGMTTSRIAALGLLNPLTVKQCSTDKTNTCQSIYEIEVCKQNSGQCSSYVDGYFIEVGVCTICGLVWYLTLGKILDNLQFRQISEWRIENNEGDGVHILPIATEGFKNEVYILPELVNDNLTIHAKKTEEHKCQTGQTSL